MRWADIIKATTAAAASNPVLMVLYKDKIRAAGAAEFEFNCLEYTLVSNSLAEEIWEPCTIQWDQFTKNLGQLVDSEQALMEMFHSDIPVRINGVYMWTEFVDGMELASPNQHGFYGRGLRFRFSPIRSEYVNQ